MKSGYVQPPAPCNKMDTTGTVEMQNKSVHTSANHACENERGLLSYNELETLLRAEIEMTGRGMREGLQLFADMRDRNMQAQFKLIALRAGQVSHA